MTQSHTPTPSKTFSVIFKNEPWRNTSFQVRGICEYDVLNPCWDDRPTDVAGRHWAGDINGDGNFVKACASCTKAALAKAAQHG